MFGEIDEKQVKSIQEHSNEIEEDFNLSLEDRIVDWIAKNRDVIIKSQQKHEPDFTLEERKKFCREILEINPSKFLFRFGKYLQREHLQYFNTLSGNSELKHYILETQKLLNENTVKTRNRNRRFAALKKMTKTLPGSSCYFADAEMRNREPLLYKELVTDNLTDEERSNEVTLSAASSTKINTFSDFLLEQLDRKQIELRRQQQERMDDDCCEENDDSDDGTDDPDGTDNDGTDNDGTGTYDEAMSSPCGVSRPLDASEKELLRNEFRSAMYSQFISGQDRDFDYSKIDENSAEFDEELLKWQSRDEEERYFDADEDPQSSSEEVSRTMDCEK